MFSVAFIAVNKFDSECNSVEAGNEIVPTSVPFALILKEVTTDEVAAA